jgi:hypothetical protein
MDTASLEYACSVARALLVKAKTQRKDYAVIICHGEPIIRRANVPIAGRLVGIYNWHADLQTIVEDIVVTIRGEYANRPCVKKATPEV